MPAVLAAREAETGGSLEPGILGQPGEYGEISYLTKKKKKEEKEVEEEEGCWLG